MMAFDTTTFILEIINFLILVWILQRLFYKPLLDSITTRKAYIEKALTDANRQKQEADELRVAYENRQSLWEQEKKAAFAELQQQIAEERNVQLENLRSELDKERQKMNASISRQQLEFTQQTEQQALLNGAKFAGLILQQTASPELEIRLIKSMLETWDITNDKTRLQTEIQNQTQLQSIIVTSAYPLEGEIKHMLELKINTIINTPLPFVYHQDNSLIAGVRIDIGAWVLNANIKQELAGFADLAYESD
jgi:F-type H+-transporting ATPase subunit b